MWAEVELSDARRLDVYVTSSRMEFVVSECGAYAWPRFGPAHVGGFYDEETARELGWEVERDTPPTSPLLRWVSPDWLEVWEHLRTRPEPEEEISIPADTEDADTEDFEEPDTVAGPLTQGLLF